MAQQKVFSGIQPTGETHLGNYLGALRNWVRLQADYDTIYCIVDLHALTRKQDPAVFGKARLAAAKMLLAVGINPNHSLLYYQSQVPQHTELSWILSTLTQLGSLNRMTQFKEKSRGGAEGANLGLYSYPVLQAADILVHHVHKVPVGDDQKQHLELSRDLAERFNRRYGDEFPVPEPVIGEKGARIMSLKDPTAKMDKSAPDPASRIWLLDDPDVVRKKLARAVTDSGHEVRYDWAEKPGITNLLEILSLMTDRPVEDLEKEYGDTSYGDFKGVVAEAVISGLASVRQAYASLEDEEVERIMQEGALDARSKAEAYQVSVRKRVGLAA